MIGGYCERIICFGLFILIEFDKDDEIYRDEVWSLCVFYNFVGCDLLKMFEIVEIDIEFDFYEYKVVVVVFVNWKIFEGCVELVDEVE